MVLKLQGLRKRICAFSMALLLSFSACAVDYLEVQAIEWAGVTVAFDTALKFLLGLLGVTVGVGVAEEINWDEMRSNCIEFQQNQGNSSVAVSNWWADVIHGSLDMASDCWDSFKEWVKTQIKSNAISGDIELGVTSINSALSILGDSFGFSSTWYSQGDVSTKTFKAFTVYFNDANNLSNPTVRFYTSDVPVFVNYSSGYLYLDVTSNYNGVVNTSTGLFNSSFSSSGGRETYRTNTGSILYFSDNIQGLYGLSDSVVSFAVVGDIPVEGDFDSAYEDVEDIAIANDGATSLPVTDSIPLPWENVADSADAVDDAISDAQEKVIDGTWTLNRYWEWVQNVTNTYAYSITNNYLLPNENNEDKPANDKVQENVSNNAFALAGLEKVFPFCIPWDIYDFINLLVADPVAPVIRFPVRNPATGQDEYIEVDFAEWEDIVIVVRYIFDFLLIIGLLLLARSLIGAGGSD